jgi:hypothetical protein
MTLPEFKRSLEAALKLHFPNARLILTESRGVAVTCRAELTADVLLAVYFNALTGNTSYALIHQGQRVAGFDNHRFWHAHPLGAADQHIPCDEPTPEVAVAELAAVNSKLLS